MIILMNVELHERSHRGLRLTLGRTVGVKVMRSNQPTPGLRHQLCIQLFVSEGHLISQ